MKKIIIFFIWLSVTASSGVMAKAKFGPNGYGAYITPSINRLPMGELIRSTPIGSFEKRDCIDAVPFELGGNPKVAETNGYVPVEKAWEILLSQKTKEKEAIAEDLLFSSYSIEDMYILKKKTRKQDLVTAVLLLGCIVIGGLLILFLVVGVKKIQRPKKRTDLIPSYI